MTDLSNSIAKALASTQWQVSKGKSPAQFGQSYLEVVRGRDRFKLPISDHRSVQSSKGQFGR